MTADSFHLRIVTPRGVLLDEAGISSVVAWGAEGKFEILPGHGRFITPLRIQEMKIRRGSGRRVSEDRWAVSGGVIEVDRKGVTVTTPEAEAAAEIDVERARQTRERALDFLRNGEVKGAALVRARWALQRSEIRLLVTAWRESGRLEESGPGR